MPEPNAQNLRVTEWVIPPSDAAIRVFTEQLERLSGRFTPLECSPRPAEPFSEWTIIDNQPDIGEERDAVRAARIDAEARRRDNERATLSNDDLQSAVDAFQTHNLKLVYVLSGSWQSSVGYEVLMQVTRTGGSREQQLFACFRRNHRRTLVLSDLISEDDLMIRARRYGGRDAVANVFNAIAKARRKVMCQVLNDETELFQTFFDFALMDDDIRENMKTPKVRTRDRVSSLHEAWCKTELNRQVLHLNQIMETPNYIQSSNSERANRVRNARARHQSRRI